MCNYSKYVFFQILAPRDEDKDPVDVQVEQPQQEV